MSDDICWVCNEAADDSDSVFCNGCGQRFHLNQRNDQPGKDCGDVWINDEYLSLQFGCLPCMQGETPKSAQVEEITQPRRRRIKRPAMPQPTRRHYRRQSDGADI